MFRIVVAGDRYWEGVELERKIRALLLLMPKDPDGNWNVELAHGGCRGVDTAAGKVARGLGIEVTRFPAEWHLYGLAAGPIRNQKMLDWSKEKESTVYIFHRSIERSKGSKEMLRRATKQNVPVYVIDEETPL